MTEFKTAYSSDECNQDAEQLRCIYIHTYTNHYWWNTDNVKNYPSVFLMNVIIQSTCTVTLLCRWIDAPQTISARILFLHFWSSKKSNYCLMRLYPMSLNVAHFIGCFKFIQCFNVLRFFLFSFFDPYFQFLRL